MNSDLPQARMTEFPEWETVRRAVRGETATFPEVVKDRGAPRVTVAWPSSFGMVSQAAPDTMCSLAE